MTDWTDDDDLTEPNETDSEPIMGVTGGQRAGVGDEYVLSFFSDGEPIDTDNGKRVAFDARLLDASFVVHDGDGNRVEDADDVRFMTGSSRFLAELKEHDPVGGDAYRVHVDGTGYDAAYTIEPVTGDDDGADE